MFDLGMLRRILGRSSCERLLKYESRRITFTGLTADTGNTATFGLGSFDTDVKTLRHASETAKILDDYQYVMCFLMRDVDKKSKEFRDIFKGRIAAITMITAFRMALVASKDDPGKFESQIKDLISKMQALADEVKPEKKPGKIIIESFQEVEVGEADEVVESPKPLEPKVPESKDWLPEPQRMDAEAIEGGEGVLFRRGSLVTKKRDPVGDALRFVGIKPSQISALMKEHADG